MATGQVPPLEEEDEFGFTTQPAVDPTNTGVSLNGEPNPPLIPPVPEPISGFSINGGTGQQTGTGGTGSIANPLIGGGTPGGTSGGGAFGFPPEPGQLTATDGGAGTGEPGNAVDPYGFSAATSGSGSGGANQTSAYIPPNIADVTMPNFGDPSAGLPGRDRMGLDQELSQYALDFMRSPTRYDIDVVQQAMTSIENRMNRVRQDSGNDIKAFLANRGVLGTSAGGELYADNQLELSEQEQSQLANLRREQAMTAGQDRAMAGQYGLDVGKFGEQQYQFDVDSVIRTRSQELQKYGIDTNKAVAMAQLEQNAQQFGLDYALRERSLELEAQGMTAQQARYEADMEFRRVKQMEDEKYRRDVFGFEQDEGERGWKFRYDELGIDRNGGNSSPGNTTQPSRSGNYVAKGDSGFEDKNGNGKLDPGEYIYPRKR